MKLSLRKLGLLALLASSLLLAACASTSTSEKGQSNSQDHDPFEGFNRAMFTLNDKLDTYIMKPVATFYNKVMPRPLNTGINNMYQNINTVPTVVNDLLQANFYQATSDAWRLGINSTVGLAGFFDVAKHMDLEYNEETFGLTLAKWGWTQSDYLVLPFFGPNTIRSTIGKPVDWLFSVQRWINPWFPVRVGVYTLQFVNERAQLLQYQGVFNQAALDPYVFIRNAYLQRQAYLIKRDKNLDDPYTAKETQEYEYEYEDFDKI
jgi:phospholipid-binding lipoprotein MlaA